MNQDPTSLDHLHDLVMPPAVPWWPPAPGWYAVAALLALLVAWLVWRSWKCWRANAYRRAALRELGALEDAAAIAELLRRTALAIVPRGVIAELTGTRWTGWLAAQCPGHMPDTVRTQLTTGAYRPGTSREELRALRAYAARWIVGHHVAAPDTRSPD